MPNYVAVGTLGGPLNDSIEPGDVLVDGSGNAYLLTPSAGSSVTYPSVITTGNASVGGALAVTGAIDCESTLTLDSDLLWESDGGGDIGAAGANRPDNIYAASQVLVPEVNFSTAYTVAGAPTGALGDLRYFSNGNSGSPCLAVFNGSNHLRVETGGAVGTEGADLYPVGASIERAIRTELGTSGYAFSVAAVTVEPDFVFIGDDLAADGSTWVDRISGTTLSLAGAGSSPTKETNQPWYGAATQYQDGKYHIDSGTTLGDWTDGSKVISMILIKVPQDLSLFPSGFNKRDVATGYGWIWYINNLANGGELTFAAVGPSGAEYLESKGVIQVLSYGGYYLGLAVVDPSENSDNGGKLYVNAVLEESDNFFGLGSFSNSGSLTIGKDVRGGGNSKVTAGILFAWHATTTQNIGTPTDWQQLAREVMARLSGLYLKRHSDGGDNLVFTSYQRTNGTKTLWRRDTDGVTRWFVLGEGLPGVGRRLTTDGLIAEGYDAWSAHTNLCLQSQNLAATWGKEDAGDSFSANSTSDPFGVASLDGLIIDSTDGNHGVTQDINLTAAAHTFFGVAKAGTHDWIRVLVSSLANVSAYIDLTNAVEGTVGSACTTYVEDLGNDLVYWELRYTGTAAAHTHVIRPADGDGDDTTSGDGASVAVHLGCHQVTATPYGVPFIPTTTGAASRPADYLRYVLPSALLDNQEGAHQVDYWSPNHDRQTTIVLAEINDDGSSGVRTQIGASGSGAAFWRGDNGAAQWNITGTTNIADGNPHTVLVVHSVNNARGPVVDGTSEGTPDLSNSPPQGQNRWLIGTGDNTTGGDGLFLRVTVSPDTGYSRAAAPSAAA